MSKNKYQLARYRRIHELLTLRKGAVVSPHELCRACEASPRTLDNDLSYMREEYGAPILWDKKRRGYYYEYPFDLSSQIALNIEDVHRLQLAVETLAQFEHLDAFRELRTTVEKIRKGVNGWVRSGAAAKAIYFEPIQYDGTRHLPALLRAVEEQRVVQFQYRSFQRESLVDCRVSPYLIRQYDQRWYVVGESPQYDYLKPFALERIVGVPQLTGEFFEKPARFDPGRAFRHTYGMHLCSPGDEQEVLLEFSPLQARYFLSKPFHAYELLEENADKTIVKLRVGISIELVRKIASYGSEVRVLSPESLRRTLLDFFEEAAKRYRR